MKPRHRRMAGLVGLAILAALCGVPVLGGDDKPGEKRYTVELRAMPWAKVFEWLAETTGLPVVGDALPTGTFTFVSPPKRTYTVSQILDLVNEGLLGSKRALVRRDGSLLVVSADERVDPALVPLVRVEELAKRGKTEVVRTMLSLDGLDPKEALAVVKSTLGPVGQALPIGKRLLVRDTVGNLRQVVELLRELGADGAVGDATHTHAFSHVKAAEARKILESLTGEGALQLKVDERTNTINIRGSAERVRQAVALLNRIDRPGNLAIDPGSPELKVYPIPGGDAAAVAKTLQTLYRGASVRISVAGGKILVYGSPKDQDAIAAIVQQVTTPAGVTRDITLERGDAAALAESLQEMLSKMRSNPVRLVVPGGKVEPAPKPAANAPGKPDQPLTITAAGNKLTLACDDPQMLTLAQELVKLLTSPVESGPEVIPLRFATAVDVAKALDELFNGPPDGSGRTAKRARIVPEPITNTLLVQASPLDIMTIRRLVTRTMDVARERDDVTPRTYTVPLRHAPAAEVAKVLRDVYAESKASLSIGVDRRTNSLILRSWPGVYEEVRKLAEQLDVRAEKKKE